MILYFDRDTKKYRDLDDDKIYILDHMEVYEPVNVNTSFTITAREDIDMDIEEAEVRFITFYPMLESVEQALKAQDFVEVE